MSAHLLPHFDLRRSLTTYFEGSAFLTDCVRLVVLRPLLLVVLPATGGATAAGRPLRAGEVVMPAGHSPYVLTLVQRSSHETNTSCDGVQKVDTLRPYSPREGFPHTDSHSFSTPCGTVRSRMRVIHGVLRLYGCPRLFGSRWAACC